MRKIWRSIAALGLILLVFWGIWKLSSSRTFQVFGDIVPRVETGRKVVALTFDDGPVPEATGEILNILGRHDVKGTFFLMGADLEKYPDLGRQIAAAGHEIGNHSYHHERMILKSMSFIRNEIEPTDDLIRKTGYQGPIHFRAPFCKKLVMLPLYLEKNDRKMITWDLEPDSYPEVSATPQGIVSYVVESARPGSIILLHVMYKSRRTSMLAVDGIVEGLKAKGFDFKTVSELLELQSL